MCLLIGTVSQVSDVAHEHLVKKFEKWTAENYNTKKLLSRTVIFDGIHSFTNSAMVIKCNERYTCTFESIRKLRKFEEQLNISKTSFCNFYPCQKVQGHHI